MKKLTIAFALLFVTRTGLTQALHCDPTKTIADCFAVFAPQSSATQPAKDQAAADLAAQSLVQQILSTANTGISSVSSPAQSTVKDFASLLSAFLDIPTSNSGSKPITLDHNFPIHVFGGDEERLKLEAILAKPDLNTEVTNRLTGNDAAVTALKKDLSELDDATVSLTLSPSTRHMGRSITPHRDVYQTLLAPRITDKTQAEADLALENLLDDLNIPDTELHKPINSIRGLDVAVVEAAARGAALQNAIDLATKFAVLLNNQPQFYGSAIYHSRKDVAGFDERSVRIAYEMGFHNLNEFYAHHQQCSEAKTITTPAAANACATDLISFVKASKTDDDPANRFSFALEYKGSSAWNVVIPQYSLNFSAPKAHTFIYSIGYGRNTTMKEGRIDVAVNYEDSSVSHVSDNVALSVPGLRTAMAADASSPVHDRFVASLTYTQKVSENLTIPISFIYANHASFLGDVSRKLNAHFGINYKLPGKK
jgi:hypothetical protein